MNSTIHTSDSRHRYHSLILTLPLITILASCSTYKERKLSSHIYSNEEINRIAVDSSASIINKYINTSANISITEHIKTDSVTIDRDITIDFSQQDTTKVQDSRLIASQSHESTSVDQHTTSEEKTQHKANNWYLRLYSIFVCIFIVLGIILGVKYRTIFVLVEKSLKKYAKSILNLLRFK